MKVFPKSIDLNMMVDIFFGHITLYLLFLYFVSSPYEINLFSPVIFHTGLKSNSTSILLKNKKVLKEQWTFQNTFGNLVSFFLVFR